MLIASLKNYFKLNERLLARPVCHGNSMMRDRFKWLTERKIVTAKKNYLFQLTFLKKPFQELAC